MAYSTRHEEEEVREKAMFKRIKRRVLIGLPIFLVLLIWLTCFKMISPGYVGVVVDLFGDNKGVEVKEKHVGMHWIAPWKNVYVFPIFEQNDTWEGNDEFHFQTSEGLACSAAIGITYHLKPDYIPIIFGKYRRGMDDIAGVFIRNFIRDAINKSASKMKIEDLYGPGKEAYLEDVQATVQKDLKPIGIEVSRIYLIGRFHFPENVIAALNSKIEATQRAQQRENELREAEAQARKIIAKAEGDAKCRIIEAESQAEANLLMAESITQELLAKQLIEKWDGKLPQIMGAVTPIVQMTPQKKGC